MLDCNLYNTAVKPQQDQLHNQIISRIQDVSAEVYACLEASSPNED